MQTLTSVRRRGWSGRIASLPLSFFLFFLFSLPRPQVELFVRSGPMIFAVLVLQVHDCRPYTHLTSKYTRLWQLLRLR